MFIWCIILAGSFMHKKFQRSKDNVPSNTETDYLALGLGIAGSGLLQQLGIQILTHGFCNKKDTFQRSVQMLYKVSSKQHTGQRLCQINWLLARPHILNHHVPQCRLPAICSKQDRSQLNNIIYENSLHLQTCYIKKKKCAFSENT